MDTEETAGAIRQFLLELDPERRSKAYCKAAREYMQWAARIEPEERIKQEALRQVYEQQRRGRGPLINRKKRPHRGWEWRTSSCRLKDGHHVAVEGWLPPGWADWPRHKPSSRLSLEVLLAALAVFHDLALPQTPPLMDYQEERPDAQGGFLWHLRTIFKYGTSIQSLDEPGIDAWGLPIAQSYLDHAKALLGAEDAAIAKARARAPRAGKDRGWVFICYCHKDKKWLDEMRNMLAPVIRRNVLPVWHDRKIKPGEKWRIEIVKALGKTRVGVLLVTKNFFASQFINEVELKYLLENAQTNHIKLLPVYVGHCMWEKSPLGELQFANDTAKPLAQYRGANRDRLLKEVCEKIQAAYNEHSRLQE